MIKIAAVWFERQHVFNFSLMFLAWGALMRRILLAVAVFGALLTPPRQRI